MRGAYVLHDPYLVIGGPGRLIKFCSLLQTAIVVLGNAFLAGWYLVQHRGLGSSILTFTDSPWDAKGCKAPLINVSLLADYGCTMLEQVCVDQVCPADCHW